MRSTIHSHPYWPLISILLVPTILYPLVYHTKKEKNQRSTILPFIVVTSPKRVHTEGYAGPAAHSIVVSYGGRTADQTQNCAPSMSTVIGRQLGWLLYSSAQQETSMEHSAVESSSLDWQLCDAPNNNGSLDWQLCDAPNNNGTTAQ